MNYNDVNPLLNSFRFSYRLDTQQIYFQWIIGNNAINEVNNFNYSHKIDTKYAHSLGDFKSKLPRQFLQFYPTFEDKLNKSDYFKKMKLISDLNKLLINHDYYIDKGLWIKNIITNEEILCTMDDLQETVLSLGLT